LVIPALLKMLQEAYKFYIVKYTVPVNSMKVGKMMAADTSTKETVIFTASDFDVFTIPGLEPRMEALIANVRPKLTTLGTALAPDLTAAVGMEMFPHVAKHARRTVHAPND